MLPVEEQAFPEVLWQKPAWHVQAVEREDQCCESMIDEERSTEEQDHVGICKPE